MKSVLCFFYESFRKHPNFCQISRLKLKNTSDGCKYFKTVMEVVEVVVTKLLAVLGLSHASQESSAVCSDFPQTGVMLWK